MSTRQSASDEPSCSASASSRWSRSWKLAVVAETRERVGQREAHRLQRLEGRALVESDREQRADERDRERRRALPEDDSISAAEAMSANGAVVCFMFSRAIAEEGLAGGGREHGADQDEVDDPVVEEPAQQHPRDEDRRPRSPGHARPRRRRRAPRGRTSTVVGDAQRRPCADDVRDRRPSGCDDHARGPAEQDDRGDGEDEARA